MGAGSRIVRGKALADFAQQRATPTRRSHSQASDKACAFLLKRAPARADLFDLGRVKFRCQRVPHSLDECRGQLPHVGGSSPQLQAWPAGIFSPPAAAISR